MIVDLNLAATDLDDAALASIGALPAVTHLRLARNRLTDRGVEALAALPQLEYLNLYGNAAVSDAGLEALASSAMLREVYLWQTGVSAASAARFIESKPEIALDLGAAVSEPAAISPR